jgi:predicted transcriptional regulator
MKKQRNVIRYDIFQALSDRGALNAVDLAACLGLSRDVVSNAAWYLTKTEHLSVDKAQLRNHLYSLTEKGRQALADHLGARPVELGAGPPPMPPQLRGPVLSPIEWSMRHLLGAAC